MSMWEPFSEGARRSIVLAQEAAQRLGNNAIAPEHMLLGIVEPGNNAAVEALASFGVTVEDVRSAAEAMLGRGANVSQEMVFTPNAKRVIELAFEESRLRDHRYIGAEHLALGYAGLDPEAQSLLIGLGVDPAVFKARILELQPKWVVRTGPASADDPVHGRIGSAHPHDLLGDLLGRIRRLDLVGMQSAVERESQRRLYYIDTEELWKRLQAAVGRHDVIGSLMYALFIDHREERDAEQTFREIVTRMDENYGR